MKLPTPPAVATPPPEVADAGDAAVPSADGVTADGVAAPAEAAAAAIVVPEPEVPKGPPPPPPPFDYFLDLPADGAEVPFVKNYVPPPPEPEPSAIREDGLPTCNFISSFASHHVGVASDCSPPTAEGATAAPAAPAADAPVTETPAAEAAPAATEAAPAATEAPPAEAAPTA